MVVRCVDTTQYVTSDSFDTLERVGRLLALASSSSSDSTLPIFFVYLGDTKVLLQCISNAYQIDAANFHTLYLYKRTYNFVYLLADLFPDFFFSGAEVKRHCRLVGIRVTLSVKH